MLFSCDLQGGVRSANIQQLGRAYWNIALPQSVQWYNPRWDVWESCISRSSSSIPGSQCSTAQCRLVCGSIQRLMNSPNRTGRGLLSLACPECVSLPHSGSQRESYASVVSRRCHQTGWCGAVYRRNIQDQVDVWQTHHHIDGVIQRFVHINWVLVRPCSHHTDCEDGGGTPVVGVSCSGVTQARCTLRTVCGLICSAYPNVDPRRIIRFSSDPLTTGIQIFGSHLT